MQILQITTPIYLLIVLGFAAVRSGYMRAESTQGMAQFAIRICMPFLVFNAVGGSQAAALNFGFLGVYGGASALAFALAFGVFRLRGRPMRQCALAGLGGACSNSGFMGYPIAALVIGPVAATVMAMTVLIENILVLPLALALAEAAATPGAGFRTGVVRALRQLGRNPVILALVAGLVVRGLGMHLPGVVQKLVDLVLVAAPVVSLFVVGGLVASLPARGAPADAGMLAVGKLMLHPGLVAAGMLVMPGIPAELREGGVLFAAMPMLSLYPIIGQTYGETAFTATALIVLTAVSFVTVSTLIWLLPGAGL